MLKLRRVGRSNKRVTRGKVYVADDNGDILDDHGDLMTSAIHNQAYWEVLKCSQNTFDKAEQATGDSKMLQIKSTILINGDEADTISSEHIVDLIAAERARITYLKELQVSSKAINELKSKHADNISKLVDILDDREPETPN